MQSEMLYRRYLRKGDIFVHADLEGATPIIVKNRPGAPSSSISPTTLSQAGNLSVATSTAWDSKAVMSAFWVTADQVSKTAEAGGGLLPVGEFRVKGEKNFLAPSQLVLGFAVMWQVSKESLVNHKSLRTEEIPAVDQAQAVEEAAVERAESREESKTVLPIETSELDVQEQEEQEEASEDDEQNNVDTVSAANPLQPQEETTRESEVVKQDDAHDAGSADREEPEETEGHVESNEEDEGEKDAPADDQSVADGAESVTSSQTQGKRHLSARERRLLRKGKPLDTATPKSDEASGQSTPAKNGTSTKSDAKPAPAPARGRKGKTKKAASKYADQDEEERALALRLLGANSAKAQKAAAEAEAKAKREKEAEEAKKRRKAQHERAAQAERKRQALFEEGATDDYDEETAAAEAADLEWLPALVGTPQPEDEILAAIPVCAPWSSLGRYKYKIKLQPGAVKKGKAVKEILGRWVSETTTGKVKKEHAEDAGISRGAAEKLRAREGELLKGWKDTEIINTVPVSKVRIMVASGGGGGDKGKGKGGSNNKGSSNKGGKGGKKK